jgi:hypothetical protein
MPRPSKRNETLKARRTGVRAGARNTPLKTGATTHTTARHATPTAMPALEAARTSSLDSSGFCTSADASPSRAKTCTKSQTIWASAMSPKAAGSSRREMVTV